MKLISLFIITFLSFFFGGFLFENKKTEINEKSESKDVQNNICNIHPIGSFHIDDLNKKDIEILEKKAIFSYYDSKGNLQNVMSGKYRIRGNFTAKLPKKPFKIELKRPVNFAGMNFDKSWILLANNLDPSGLRNAAAMCMSNILSMDYTPDYRFVELFINDKYNGLYDLYESIKVGKNRVNIADTYNSSWLIEVDYREDKGNIIRTSKNIPYHVAYKSPDLKNKDIISFVNNFEIILQTCASGTCSKDLYKYLDIDELLKYLLVQDVFKNVDAFLASTFLSRKGNSGIKYGPLWDFDIAAGNFNGLTASDYKGFYLINANFPLADNPKKLPDPSIYLRWFFSDEENLRKYLDLMKRFYLNDFKKLEYFINHASKEIDYYLLKDKNLWKKGDYKNDEGIAEAKKMNDWLNNRMLWMIENYTLAINSGEFKSILKNDRNQ